jgi:vacuolar-type H+-ATPase subunit I/STV1
MTEPKKTGNQGIQANNVTAENMAVGENARAVQYRGATSSDELQRRLDELVAQLKQVLQQVPPENREDADAVSELTDELVEKTRAEKPNRKLLEIKAEGLKKAAENIAQVTPMVLSIATQIVEHILKLGI